MKKLLFVHNSVPEYRLSFWRNLNKFVDLDIVITEKDVEQRIYNFQKDTNGLSINYWNNDSLNAVENYDAVVLPPIENLTNYKIALSIKRKCINNGIPFYYWTEKWLLDNSKRPFLKIIKDYVKSQMIKTASRGSKRYIASGSKARQYLIHQIDVSSNQIKIAYDSSTSTTESKSINIRQKFNIPSNAKVILFFGRLISRKGCMILIDAVNPILERNNCYLLIAGSGDQLQLLEKAAKNNKRIIFAGKVQPAFRSDFYKQSDVFVLPSLYEKGVVEAWGLTINEALEFGLPVVTTDAVGAAYDLINSKNGIVVPNGCTIELREAIETILKSNLINNREEIRQFYNANYSVDQMSDSFFKAIFE